VNMDGAFTSYQSLRAKGSTLRARERQRQPGKARRRPGGAAQGFRACPGLIKAGSRGRQRRSSLQTARAGAAPPAPRGGAAAALCTLPRLRSRPSCQSTAHCAPARARTPSACRPCRPCPSTCACSGQGAGVSDAAPARRTGREPPQREQPPPQQAAAAQAAHLADRHGGDRKNWSTGAQKRAA